MKQIGYAVICWVVLALPAIGQAEDIEKSISGIKWGAELSSAQNLMEKSRDEDDDSVYYTRPGEKYVFEGMNLGQPIYGFYEDQFYAVFFNLESKDTADAVLDFFTGRYGKPRAQLRYKKTYYIWQYNTLKAKLKYYEKKNIYKLSLYYLPLSSKLNESRVGETAEKTIKLN